MGGKYLSHLSVNIRINTQLLNYTDTAISYYQRAQCKIMCIGNGYFYSPCSMTSAVVDSVVVTRVVGEDAIVVTLPVVVGA